MTIILILILIYILSIIGCKYVFLLQSEDYLNNFNNKDCTVTPLWFIPGINSVTFILFIIYGFSEYLIRLNKSNKITNKFFIWLFNYFLIK